jgi:hypothetical protein
VDKNGSMTFDLMTFSITAPSTTILSINFEKSAEHSIKTLSITYKTLTLGMKSLSIQLEKL